MQTPHSDVASPGVRSVCDLGFRTTPAISSRSDWEAELEPGDILVCRNGEHPISQIISSLDGYWSHSALYVGGGQIVHAYSEGLGQWAIDELASHYLDGMGTMRPDRSASERSAAADWARRAAVRREGSRAPIYSGRDLGMAYAMLRRARARGGVNALPDLDRENVEDWHLDRERVVPPFAGTCSGLIYRAYSEGAECALDIIPAPGMTLRDGRLSFPPEEDLFEALLRPADPTLEALPRPNWHACVAVTKIIAGAAKGWLSLQPTNYSIDIEQGVTPADLWSSPDVSHRRFMLPAHQATALDAIKDCGDP